MKAILLIVLFALVGCSQANQKLSADGQAQNMNKRMAPFDVNKYPVTKTVCDPWGEDDPAINGGLSAELYYLRADQPHYPKVGDYFQYGQKSSQNLFFSSLFVPTRDWETGFATESGEAVKDDAGNTLVEYFALKFKSVLKLAPDESEGLYEFALLSDDGVVLKVRDEDGAYKDLVVDDSEHATRMGCSSETLLMTRDAERLIELQYFQGPRRSIALVPLWRKVSEGTQIGKDPLCGQSGRTLFFDGANGSKPMKPYLDLLARGWKPISKNNFALPMQASYNPCTNGEVPQITNLATFELGSNFIQVAWDTDLPSTSQVIYTDIATGETKITIADNVLTTQHSVVITGLKANTTYSLQAVSISESMGKGLSGKLEAKTF